MLGGIAAAVAATALMIPSTAFAQGGPGNGHGNGGGPPAGHGRGSGSSGSEQGNNLSVPTIMVGGEITANMGCGTSAGDPSDLVTPTGDPLSGYPINTAAYYYVQGVHTWQAQCYTDTSASVFGAWGANLIGGEAKLSVGKPIRVELGLMNSSTAEEPTLEGFDVVKLNPDALDRESAYGTLATQTDGTFSSNPQPYTPGQWRVYDAGVTFSIQNTETGDYVVPQGTPATAEINATGNVVYGYNLRVSVAGPYRITFTTSDTVSNTVTFTGSNAPISQGSASDNTAYLDINVTTGSGGGGGGGHGRP